MSENDHDQSPERFNPTCLILSVALGAMAIWYFTLLRFADVVDEAAMHFVVIGALLAVAFSIIGRARL